ncbi:30S ribosomal protein S14 [Candidatus Thorarchaeota archaeon]|nr:MAG: 30S ribosomal protein S14 [Candidatus Thorarchaeota archaeon]
MSTKKDRSRPRKKSGKGNRTCVRCGTHQAIIRSYNLYMCRRCFRETAEKLGFRKYQ